MFEGAWASLINPFPFWIRGMDFFQILVSLPSQTPFDVTHLLILMPYQVLSSPFCKYFVVLLKNAQYTVCPPLRTNNC